MFGTSHGTIDHEFERQYEADQRELRSIVEQKARLDQRLTVISRRAEQRQYWKAAGCSSPAQWLAQITSSEYRTAVTLVDAGTALDKLPALDQALGSGAMNLDQITAAIAYATPETDAQLARIGVGMAPTQIARAARTLAPPTVVDDAALRKRRALSLKWIEGGRELVINGRLPLEQAVAFEQAIRSAAKAQRAIDKKHGIALEWQQSTADALVTLATASGNGGGGSGSADGGGSVKRSRTTLIVHLSPDAPPMLEGAGTIAPETAEYLTCDARRLTIKRHGRDLLHSRLERCASYAQLRALLARDVHCRYPGCTAAHELEAHHILAIFHGGETVLENLLLLCSRHHKLLHDRHIRTSGGAGDPVFTDEAGRRITSGRPHAPPG
jgi:hypothetical protein